MLDHTRCALALSNNENRQLNEIMCSLKVATSTLDFFIAQVMHKAPVIHPVFNFQAIPDAMNTVSERCLVFHPKKDCTGCENGKNL